MRIAHSPPAAAPSPLPRSPAGRGREVGKSFTAVLAERVGPGPEAARPQASVPREAPAAKPTSAGPGPVRAALERLVSTENRVDALLHAAAKGKTFSPAELIALQSSVFRYSQTVEVVSRAADRIVGAVKQTMGTNV
jgi:hypothetical protein